MARRSSCSTRESRRPYRLIYSPARLMQLLQFIMKLNKVDATLLVGLEIYTPLWETTSSVVS